MSDIASLIMVFFLTALSVGGIFFAVFQPQMAKAAKAQSRLDMALGLRQGTGQDRGGNGAKRPKNSLEGILQEIAQKQDAKARKVRPTLFSRLRQARLGWSYVSYWLICSMTGIGLTGLLLTSVDPILAVGLGIAGALLLPHLYVNLRISRELKAFSAEFPNAVDVIVRGVKSGLPFGDCLRIIAAEGQEPVKSAFKAVVEDQTIGIPIDEAVQRMVQRFPLPETNFLAIVINVQSKTGGNLTEALSNLSTVLRERKKMRSKIKAVSSEAKASAGIIGSLPVIVASGVYLTSPDYISLLFTTVIGNVVLAIAALWMIIGILIMRKMINFDF